MRCRHLLAAAAVVLVVAGCGSHGSKSSVACNDQGQCYTKEGLGLPKGFTSEMVASGLSGPTSFAFLPDGRVLIAEKSGTIRVLKGGRLLPKPFLDIRSEVNSFDVRGLLAVRPDPNFERNGFVYVFYVHENGVGRPHDPKTSRLSRFKAVGDVADPSSERIILGREHGDCGKDARRTNCIPADGYHSGADIAFASDGTMFVSIGDDSDATQVDPRAFRSQDLDTLAGKILRVTSSGQGVPGNPFWTGNAGDNRSKVWAHGLRQPFRFGLQPKTDTPYVGDVGWKKWEEVDVASRGTNLGWPCYEGPDRTPDFSSFPACKKLYEQSASAVSPPLVWHGGHPNPAAVTGGVFYSASAYPASYRGLYFYGDWGAGWVRTLQVNDQGELASKDADRPFAEGLAGPVQFAVGPDGDLYVLSFSGELRRIVYTASSSS